MKKPAKAPTKSKPAPSKKSKPKTKQEWAKVIRGAESLLKSAGVKI
jgi:hypothetical protein